MGSDAIYSIPLTEERILWLFGDTLIGKMVDGRRDEKYEFIRNTVGIQDISSGIPGEVEFYWGANDDKSVDLFPSTVNTHYVSEIKFHFIWPCMGVVLDNELFLYGYRMEIGKGEFNIPTTLLRIPNPLDPPGEWIQNSADLGLGNLHQGFHSALFVKEPYVYFLGYDDKSVNPLVRRAVLARAKTKDLLEGGLGDKYEFLAKGKNGPEWGHELENFESLFFPGNTESGIQFIPEFGLYVTFTYDPGTPDIFMTVAPELAGPWSTPVSIYKVPEHNVSFPIMSYAVRPHPEFSTKPGELLISYATNTKGGMKKLFTKEGVGIYAPRFIRVQLELNK
jgi:hypothetical protein